MKYFILLLGTLFEIACVFGTYYGAWIHNWLVILIFFIPQLMKIAYRAARL